MTTKIYPQFWYKAYKKLSKTKLFYYAIASVHIRCGDNITEEQFIKIVQKEAKLWKATEGQESED